MNKTEDDYGESNAEQVRQMTERERLEIDVDAIMHMLLSLHVWVKELPDAIPDKYDMVSLLWEMHLEVSKRKELKKIGGGDKR